MDLKNDFIEISRNIKKEEIICVICLNYLNKKIFTCSNGPHYVCNNCKKNIDKCPICRNSLMFRDFFFEKELKKYLVKCPNSNIGCKKFIFNWDYKHLDNCSFYQMNCPFCKKKILKDTLTLSDHLVECEFEIEKKISTETNSLELKPTYILKNFDESDFYILFFIPTSSSLIEIYVFSTSEKLLNVTFTINNSKIKYSLRLPSNKQFTDIEDNKGYLSKKIFSNKNNLEILLKESLLDKNKNDESFESDNLSQTESNNDSEESTNTDSDEDDKSHNDSGKKKTIKKKKKPIECKQQ